jgi:hypothetical protein
LQRFQTEGEIMRMASKMHFAILAGLTGLFALRMAAQAIQRWAPQPWLPAFNDFQGSSLAYSTLLTIQLLILGLMMRTTWRVGRNIAEPSPGLGRGLAWFGGVYMAGSILRILIGLTVPNAHPWFSTWIPALFHLVLAGFVIAAAHFHLRYPERVQ